MVMEVTITLRIDFDTVNKKTKEPLMLEVVQRAARELLTTAMMLQDKRAPQVALQAGDYFASPEEVALFPEGDDHV